MGSHSEKRKQRYVGCPRDRSKLTCLITGTGNSSEQCELHNKFGTRYSTSRPFEELRKYPKFANKYKKNIEVNDIVQHAVDDILQENENTKLSANIEPQEYDNIDRKIYKKELNDLDKLSLGDSSKE